jgi:hypothetical protein
MCVGFQVFITYFSSFQHFNKWNFLEDFFVELLSIFHLFRARSSDRLKMLSPTEIFFRRGKKMWTFWKDVACFAPMFYAKIKHFRFSFDTCWFFSHAPQLLWKESRSRKMLKLFIQGLFIFQGHHEKLRKSAVWHCWFS